MSRFVQHPPASSGINALFHLLFIRLVDADHIQKAHPGWCADFGTLSRSQRGREIPRVLQIAMGKLKRKKHAPKKIEANPECLFKPPCSAAQLSQSELLIWPELPAGFCRLNPNVIMSDGGYRQFAMVCSLIRLQPIVVPSGTHTTLWKITIFWRENALRISTAIFNSYVSHYQRVPSGNFT